MIPDTTVRSMYTRPEALGDVVTHYCPGCTHGIAHRLIAEVVEEMTLRERVIGVASVGCSVFAYNYFSCDFVEAAHGRAPAMATGVKRLLPDRLVFTYQGDGDLASIGMAEIVHAAARGENISVFFINNANYGMTGGQMAPTTLPGQKTTSSPYGRNVAEAGFPIHTAEMLASLDGPAFIARQSLHDPAHVRKAKKAVRTSMEAQLRGLGFSMVELLSSCPTNWKMSPLESLKFIEEQMIPVYPLGEFKKDPALEKAGAK